MFDPVYEEAFKIVLEAEGIFSNDPDDSGGETIYGIASRYYPDVYQEVYNLWVSGDIEKAQEKTKEFYYKHFWLKCAAPKIRNREISIYLFDTAVNMHYRTAIRLLQRTLNFYLKKHSKQQLVVDGIYGRKTDSAFRFVMDIYDSRKILLVLNALRNKLYVRISYKGNNLKFLRGWINRTSNLIMKLF